MARAKLPKPALTIPDQAQLRSALDYVAAEPSLSDGPEMLAKFALASVGSHLHALGYQRTLEQWVQILGEAGWDDPAGEWVDRFAARLARASRRKVSGAWLLARLEELLEVTWLDPPPALRLSTSQQNRMMAASMRASHRRLGSSLPRAPLALELSSMVRAHLAPAAQAQLDVGVDGGTSRLDLLADVWARSMASQTHYLPVAKDVFANLCLLLPAEVGPGEPEPGTIRLAPATRRSLHDAARAVLDTFHGRRPPRPTLEASTQAFIAALPPPLAERLGGDDFVWKALALPVATYETHDAGKLAVTWLEVLECLGDLDFTEPVRAPSELDYALDHVFVVGDVLRHASFGLGRVSAVSPTRITVDFGGVARTLVHAKVR